MQVPGTVVQSAYCGSQSPVIRFSLKMSVPLHEWTMARSSLMTAELVMVMMSAQTVAGAPREVGISVSPGSMVMLTVLKAGMSPASKFNSLFPLLEVKLPAPVSSRTRESLSPSQMSPMVSASLSSWSGLKVKGQLSMLSGTPSSSVSGSGTPKV